MRHLLDTIVAPITGGHPAAVAVIRICGPKAWRIAGRVFVPWPDIPIPRLAVYGRFVNGDDGLALPFAEGMSYTGDETVEFSLHGSLVSVRGLVEACVREGARVARPGEFTLRAFMYGRVDLTQAEGVRDTVEALTDAQLRQANLLRSGRLHDEIQEVRQEVVGVLASVEASTDFSEEVGDLNRDAAIARCKAVIANIDRLIGQAEGGQLLRKGLTIAIVGLPNAGKSSILNALLGADRAIVTEYPGTTRDTVEELADLGGVPCRLIDTAGLRSTAEPIEKIGVERARHAAENADIVWYVYDIKKGWTKDDDAQLAKIQRPTTILANKCDLKASADKGLPVSAVSGAGLPGLIRSVAGKAVAPDAPLPLVNTRHLPLLEQAKAGLLDVIESLSSPVPDDLAAVGLQQAARVLGEVTGETASADVVERIFWDFCLGK